MKIKGEVYKIKGNLIAVKTDFDRWKVGDKISIRRGAQRSLAQNNFLWLYYTWLIKKGGGNLAESHGFYDPEGLHLCLKKKFLSEKTLSKGVFKVIEMGSTTELNKPEFGEYLEQVKQFVYEFFGVDSNIFFEMYQEQYAEV